MFVCVSAVATIWYVFFCLRLMPEIGAFVVIGLIPLSAPASRTHCVSFCYPQEGRTGASVFGLAMSKSALLVLSQKGYTLTHTHICTHSASSPLSSSLLWMSVSNWEQHVLFCLSRGASQHKALSCVDAGLWWLSHFGEVLQGCQLEMMFTRMLLSIRKSCCDWYLLWESFFAVKGLVHPSHTHAKKVLFRGGYRHRTPNVSVLWHYYAL